MLLIETAIGLVANSAMGLNPLKKPIGTVFLVVNLDSIFLEDVLFHPSLAKLPVWA